MVFQWVLSFFQKHTNLFIYCSVFIVFLIFRYGQVRISSPSAAPAPNADAHAHTYTCARARARARPRAPRPRPRLRPIRFSPRRASSVDPLDLPPPIQPSDLRLLLSSLVYTRITPADDRHPNSRSGQNQPKRQRLRPRKPWGS